MVTQKIIPCLDIQNNKVVKGTHFENLLLAGTPLALAKRYQDEGADELAILNITADPKNKQNFKKLIHEISLEVDLPLIVGGCINSLQEAQELINLGASKISINSAAVKTPFLINELVQNLGSSKVIVAIDTRFEHDSWWVYTQGGKVRTQIKVLTWIKEVAQRGAGEILLTSIDHDGARKGYPIDLFKAVTEQISIPVIASGGAGSITHFIELFANTRTSAALAASIFHYQQVSIKKLKHTLKHITNANRAN